MRSPPFARFVALEDDIRASDDSEASYKDTTIAEIPAPAYATTGRQILREQPVIAKHSTSLFAEHDNIGTDFEPFYENSLAAGLAASSEVSSMTTSQFCDEPVMHTERHRVHSVSHQHGSNNNGLAAAAAATRISAVQQATTSTPLPFSWEENLDDDDFEPSYYYNYNTGLVTRNLTTVPPAMTSKPQSFEESGHYAGCFVSQQENTMKNEYSDNFRNHSALVWFRALSDLRTIKIHCIL
ncbi:hypothetical protein ACA910_017480 [Epithemia clementina (nom. ined.)]